MGVDVTGGRRSDAGTVVARVTGPAAAGSVRMCASVSVGGGWRALDSERGGGRNRRKKNEREKRKKGKKRKTEATIKRGME